MGIYVKIFAIMAVLCVVSALPVEEVKQVNEPQVDLSAAEGSPVADTDESGDALTRDKRHFIHYGYKRYPIGGYYGGYYPVSYGYPYGGYGYGYGYGYQPIGYGGFWG
ncbi:unnamed protein product [Chironomus riparius]|uniref:Uncharacterized protein n=1 Tax=Chironomus riparius TaxID=315576 RepID=A0A9N9RHR2_9DIPT|nr:unnamed protein product [Chironomus riparius]